MGKEATAISVDGDLLILIDGILIRFGGLLKARLSSKLSRRLKTNQFIEIDAPKLSVMKNETDEFINPGTYGKALGLYLQSKLVALGYDVPCVVCEDWGWFVGAGRNGFQMSICVYGRPKHESIKSEEASVVSRDSEENDFAEPGTPLSLCIHVATQPRKYWSWKKFKFIDRTDIVNKLNEQILEALNSDPEIVVNKCSDEFPL